MTAWNGFPQPRKDRESATDAPRSARTVALDVPVAPGDAKDAPRILRVNPPFETGRPPRLARARAPLGAASSITHSLRVHLIGGVGESGLAVVERAPGESGGERGSGAGERGDGAPLCGYFGSRGASPERVRSGAEAREGGGAGRRGRPGDRDRARERVSGWNGRGSDARRARSRRPDV